MNLKVNYDLLEKIYESNKGIKISKSMKSLTTGSIVGIAFMSPFLYLAYDNFLLGMSMLSGVCTAFNIFESYCINKITKPIVMEAANSYLDYLTLVLYTHEIKTTTELLKQAKIIDKEYKLEYKDESSNIKSLKEYKYIDVPLSNGYTETLKQEHFIGDKDYYLSIGTPTKKINFKTVKA